MTQHDTLEKLRDFFHAHEPFQLARIDDGRIQLHLTDEQYSVIRAALSATQPAKAAQSEPTLRDYAEDLVDAGHDFWKACESEAGGGAVRWLSCDDGTLIVFTRVEYRDEIMAHVGGYKAPVVVFDEDGMTALEAQAAQSEPVKPLFASKVASRKWSELQEAGARMQSIAFDGHKSGQPGTIDPWGVVRWGQAAQGAGEVVAWQHQKPIEGPTGEIEGYTDWMDGDGLPWWPRRALYTHPTPPPAQPAPVVPDGWKLVPIKCTEAMKDVGGQFEFATISDGRLLAQSMWNELLCATPTPPAQQPEAVPSEQSRWCVYVAGMVAGWLGMDVDDPKIPTMGAIIERRLWALKRGTPPAQAAADARDAERYRLVRRGQHWSVVNGIGDTLRGEDLDAAIDAASVRPVVLRA